MPPRKSSSETRLPTASTRRMRVPGATCSTAPRTAFTAVWVPASSPCTGRRTSTVLSSPNCCRPTSPRSRAATAERSAARLAASGVRTSMVMPPLKSTPFCSPG